ncbi:hypothetical protein JVT61DRAFT_10979 [Boletus reticuloceps]|uniref:Uncharacterized protein n=1 Tax=Boletus reticuloceps TaxID=495285 RepID=A0A8I2YFA3_9AGAM|nr:hypothetical protein JVT61DRAFT_10979 [Boletus reticuloceps]
MPPPVASSHSSGTTEATGDNKECTCDSEGFIIDVIKKPDNYSNKDLPVTADSCWSCSFIPVAMLWCSMQHDVWSIAEDELAVALQVIFNTVYLTVKYHVTTVGSIFAVVHTTFP